MWEWQAPEGWRAYDDLCQKALEEVFRSYAGGLRMRVGWFAAVPGRQYTVHMPSRKHGGVFKQQNMTTGVYRKVRRDREEHHIGYEENIQTSLWGAGSEDTGDTPSAPPPPPPDAPPEDTSSPSSSSSSSSSSTTAATTTALPRKWANPILKTQKSLDFATASPLPVSVLMEPFRWASADIKKEEETGLVITTVSESKNGSGGVMFIETNKGVFVLKGSPTMAADLFANQLAEKFLTLKIPKCRIVSYGSREFSDLAMLCLEQLVRQSGQKVPFRPETDWYLSHPFQNLFLLAGSAARIFQSGFLALMEFIPGFELSKLEEKNVMDMEETLRAARFADLGAIVCLDLLTNNWDRLPLSQLWSHGGNLGNIMLTNTGIVAIDNSVTAIRAARDKIKLQNYLKGVWVITSEAFHCHAHSKLSRCFEDVRTALWAVNGFDVGNACLSAMQSRFIESVKAVSVLTLSQLQTLQTEVKRPFLLEHMEVTDESIGMNRVDFSFFQFVVDLVLNPLSKATSWTSSAPQFSF